MTTEIFQPELNIKINGTKIEQVTEFIYLATNYPFTTTEVAVKHGIGLRWAAFGKHEYIMK